MAAASSGPAAVSAEMGPVAPQERVPLYDVLRGFCLFGVLWSNLNDWYTVAEPVTRLDHAIRWTQDWLLESRLYSLLAFLFGIGFAIQLTRAAQRGQDARNLFLRRMTVLLGFGLVHATLIWNGDILTSYALAGFILVLFRRWSPHKLLLAIASLCVLFPYLAGHLAGALALPRYDDAWGQLINQARQASAHGTWTQSVGAGVRLFWGGQIRGLLSGNLGRFLALFLLGLWAMRVDLIARLTSRRVYVARALLGTLLCWAALQYLQYNVYHWWTIPSAGPVATWRELRFWWPPRWDVLSFFDAATTWVNATVYALLFALAMSFPAAKKRLRPLAALGRMTLTTYLIQSVVCTALFYNWGFGLMNRTNLTGILLFTLVLFSLQIAFSVWWLNRYRFGPGEWLWRSLAYGRKLPLRTASDSTSSAGGWHT